MLTLDRILVPTDFSEGASAAYAYANALATKYGGKIDLLHVIPSFRYLHESISRLGLPIDMDKDIYPPLLHEIWNACGVRWSVRFRPTTVERLS